MLEGMCLPHGKADEISYLKLILIFIRNITLTECFEKKAAGTALVGTLVGVGW